MITIYNKIIRKDFERKNNESVNFVYDLAKKGDSTRGSQDIFSPSTSRTPLYLTDYIERNSVHSQWFDIY